MTKAEAKARITAAEKAVAAARDGAAWDAAVSRLSAAIAAASKAA